jgi:hypothetical protein
MLSSHPYYLQQLLTAASTRCAYHIPQQESKSNTKQPYPATSVNSHNSRVNIQQRLQHIPQQPHPADNDTMQQHSKF